MKSAAATPAPLGLPDDIPWQQTVGLLLDAVQVVDLLKRLYRWAELPSVKVLYLGTRLAALQHLSPCLVRISGPNDPILAQYLDHLDQKWGYLLVSEASWEQTAAHLQWLTSVEHWSGQEMLLRIAYPDVADALFGSADCVLFGPCQRVITADYIKGGWNQYYRSGDMPQQNFAAPYCLSERQAQRLMDASAHKTISDLSEHMAYYFPEYYANLTHAERDLHLQTLVHRAGEHGFNSEKALYLYCNAHGFVGGQALEEPAFAMFLEPCSTDESPTCRAQGLASLAHKRSRP